MGGEFKIVETRDYFYLKRNGFDVFKEEIRQLERLLYEAKNRLAKEYEKKGGQSWYEYVWEKIGYY